MSIKISKDGIEFDYRRFLSDSAAGYIIILLLLLNFYHPVLTESSFSGNMLVCMSKETKTFLGFLLFLLATPLGMLVNAVGWYLLGWLQHCLEIYCFTLSSTRWLKLIFKPTAEEFQLPEIEQAFGLTKDNWIETSRFFADFLKHAHKDLFEEYRYIEGVRIFLRSLSTLALLLSLLRLFTSVHMSNQSFSYWYTVLACAAIVVCLLILTGLVSFYYQLALMSLVYRVCLQNNKYAPLEDVYDRQKRLRLLMGQKRDMLCQ